MEVKNNNFEKYYNNLNKDYNNLNKDFNMDLILYGLDFEAQKNLEEALRSYNINFPNLNEDENFKNDFVKYLNVDENFTKIGSDDLVQSLESLDSGRVGRTQTDSARRAKHVSTDLLEKFFSAIEECNYRVQTQEESFGELEVPPPPDDAVKFLCDFANIMWTLNSGDIDKLNELYKIEKLSVSSIPKIKITIEEDESSPEKKLKIEMSQRAGEHDLMHNHRYQIIITEKKVTMLFLDNESVILNQNKPTKFESTIKGAIDRFKHQARKIHRFRVINIASIDVDRSNPENTSKTLFRLRIDKEEAEAKKKSINASETAETADNVEKVKEIKITEAIENLAVLITTEDFQEAIVEGNKSATEKIAKCVGNHALKLIEYIHVTKQRSIIASVFYQPFLLPIKWFFNKVLQQKVNASNSHMQFVLGEIYKDIEGPLNKINKK